MVDDSMVCDNIAFSTRQLDTSVVLRRRLGPRGLRSRHARAAAALAFSPSHARLGWFSQTQRPLSHCVQNCISSYLTAANGSRTGSASCIPNGRMSWLGWTPPTLAKGPTPCSLLQSHRPQLGKDADVFCW